MNKASERRFFFKHILSSVSRWAAALPLPDHPGPEPGETGGMPEIMADLTPELLAFEARRLGLDPQKDPHRVIQSLQAAMDRPEGKGNGM